MDYKLLFLPYQNEMLRFANTPSGRRFLGIPEKERILKIDYNSYHLDMGKNIKAIVRTYPVYLKKVDEILGVDLFRNSRINNFRFASGDPIYSSAGDGGIYRTLADTWAVIRAEASGNAASGADATGYFVIANSDGTTRSLGRSFYPFDTSVITTPATIVAGGNKFHWQFDSWGADVGTRPTITIVESTVVSTTVLGVDDFNNFGTTEYTDTRFNTAGKVVDTDYTITLNTAGDAFISKTGFTKFCIRTNYDFDNSDPTATTQQEILSYFSEQTGTSQDPYLEIYYTLPGGNAMIFGGGVTVG